MGTLEFERLLDTVILESTPAKYRIYLWWYHPIETQLHNLKKK